MNTIGKVADGSGLRQEALSAVKPAPLAEDGFETEVEEFKPLTTEEAQQWRATQVSLSIWRVIAWQAVAVLVVSLQ